MLGVYSVHRERQSVRLVDILSDLIGGDNAHWGVRIADIEQVLREKKPFIPRCMLGDIKKLQGRIVTRTSG
jgi:hypothetical protein